QMQRQFFHEMRRDRCRTRIAVAGGDAIDDAVLAQQIVEKARAGVDALAHAGAVAEAGAPAPRGERDDVFDAEASRSEYDIHIFTHSVLWSLVRCCHLWCVTVLSSRTTGRRGDAQKS